MNMAIMAIMAMVTARKINYSRLAKVMALLAYFTSYASTAAGEWQFVPKIEIEETYSDNVELTLTDQTSSLVSQAIIGIDAAYQSRLASFSFNGSNNNLFYSHDSDINDSYLTLNTQGQYLLGHSGFAIFASVSVGNSNRNSAVNGLADLVSGDTVQSEDYTAGISYNVNNSSYILSSSVDYNVRRFEDGIGEFDGISASLSSRNNHNARVVFWQLVSNYSKRNQDTAGATRTGKQYNVDGKLGLITSLNINPFIHFYDEDFSGNFGNQNRATTASWGPGVRWLISQHLQVDLSYNYVSNDAISDNYVAGSLQWEPSARTSLSAGFSQRFFGDSYNLNFQHRTKRLTNSVTYNESLDVFDRNNFELVNLGIFFCPSDTIIDSISQCFSQAEQPATGEFELQNFFSLEPIESNEFSINKRLVWNSILQLSRTSFGLKTTASRRETLVSNIVNDTLSADFTIDRKLSGKSNLALSVKFDYRIFDKNNPEGRAQEDYYRTISTTYSKSLAPALTTYFTLQHVNRNSSSGRFTYDEMRAIINVTKEF